MRTMSLAVCDTAKNVYERGLQVSVMDWLGPQACCWLSHETGVYAHCNPERGSQHPEAGLLKSRCQVFQHYTHKRTLGGDACVCVCAASGMLAGVSRVQ